MAGCKGCCVYPQGFFLVSLAIILAVASWILSISVHATCHFVKANNALSTGFGMWTKENLVPTPSNDYSCQAYDFTDIVQFDTKWNSAAGMAYTAGTIGFVFTVLLMSSSCVRFSRNFFKLTCASFIVAGILDFCTLIGVNSDICATLTNGDSCEFSTGAGLAIGAGIGYFLTAATVWCIHPPDDTDKSENEQVQGSAKAPSEPMKSGSDEVEGPNTEVPAGNAESPEDSQSNDKSKDDVEVTQNVEADDTEGAEASLDDAKQDDDESSASDDGAPRGFCLVLWSNLLFLLGSIFYMLLAVDDLQWANEVVAFLGASLKDKVKWWWNSPEYAPGDCVFQTRFHCVSAYQIVYFIAAFAFVLEGFVDFFGTPAFRGIFFTFAGTFGLIAAWTAERDPNLSSIFNLISSHLFMFEAIGLLLYRDEYSGRIKRLVFLNDICFVVATMMDVVLGYLGVLNSYSLAIAKSETASAALWLFCAVFYVTATLYAKRVGHFDKQKNVDSDDKEEQIDETP